MAFFGKLDKLLSDPVEESKEEIKVVPNNSEPNSALDEAWKQLIGWHDTHPHANVGTGSSIYPDNPTFTSATNIDMGLGNTAAIGQLQLGSTTTIGESIASASGVSGTGGYYNNANVFGTGGITADANGYLKLGPSSYIGQYGNSAPLTTAGDFITSNMITGGTLTATSITVGNLPGIVAGSWPSTTIVDGTVSWPKTPIINIPASIPYVMFPASMFEPGEDYTELVKEFQEYRKLRKEGRIHIKPEEVEAEPIRLEFERLVEI